VAIVDRTAAAAAVAVAIGNRITCRLHLLAPMQCCNVALPVERFPGA